MKHPPLTVRQHYYHKPTETHRLGSVRTIGQHLVAYCLVRPKVALVRYAAFADEINGQSIVYKPTDGVGIGAFKVIGSSWPRPR